MSDLKTTVCPTCGALFGLTPAYMEARRADSAWFYCPNGHSQRYTESEADRLKKQLEKERGATARAEQDAQWARNARDAANRNREHAERRVRTYKGHNTRLKRRLAAGKCPACHTEFHDLAEHMGTEHPGYGGSNV